MRVKASAVSEERDRQARRVEGEQQRAVAGGVRERGALTGSPPSVGPTHGVQAIAKAAPATIGPPLPARSSSASTCHSRFSRVDEQGGDEEDAHRDDQRRRDLLERRWWSWSVDADARSRSGPSRMKIAEKLATKSRLGARTRRQPASSMLARGDPGDRRQVAGDERQHAGGEERDEARGERGEDPDSGGGIAVHRPNSGGTRLRVTTEVRNRVFHGCGLRIGAGDSLTFPPRPPLIPVKRWPRPTGSSLPTLANEARRPSSPWGRRASPFPGALA